MDFLKTLGFPRGGRRLEEPSWAQMWGDEPRCWFIKRDHNLFTFLLLPRARIWTLSSSSMARIGIVNNR